MPQCDRASIAAACSLAVCFDLGMHHAHVSREGIVARESLLLAAQRAADLLLAAIVDGVLVAGQVIRS